MSIEEVREKSGLKMEVVDSLYWKCLWLRDVKPNINIDWMRLLRDKKYRCSQTVFLSKH